MYMTGNSMQISPNTELPSLPEVTLRALEACRKDDSYRHISNIISADTALTTQVLAMANSSLYGRSGEIRSVEQALLRLGTERLRTLILTAALRQLMFDLGADQWQQLRDFWRHSLTTALTAKTLATLTRYPSADEAFMLGMLHNIGELIALKMTPGDLQQQYLDHQAEIGAQLAQAWGLGQMAADAMRYQKAPASEIRDAAHLVKLINLSTRLAQSDAAGIAAAGTIFSLSEDLTRELSLRINHEVAALAQSLGVTLEHTYDGHKASQTLRNTVIRQAMTDQALSPANDSGPALASTVVNLTLLTGCPSLFFRVDDGILILASDSQGEPPDMTIVAASTGSVLTQSFRDQKAVLLAERSPNVLDKQLLALLNTSSLIAVPVLFEDVCQGVFVIGTDAINMMSTLELAEMFCARLSHLTASKEAKIQDDVTAADIDQALAQDNVRRYIHEISNPLTIIRQYIYQLRGRLENEQVREQLDIIREELERAGNLLVQMGESQEPNPNTDEPTSLNRELRALHALFQDSLFRNGDIDCDLVLSEESTDLAAGRAPVRQVILNLIRNAVECMPDGGKLRLESASPVWQQGRQWIEMLIEDNGPGLPKAIQSSLFKPVKSSKGVTHSGLGLSIVKQLIDDMEGIIGYRTGSSGTSFRLLLPAVSDSGKGPT
ncbi:HDOD domain-containing protein [Marinobacter psychrophilus]|uniref:HDOD domain-containing protein n=1 Tax=Marinobacter psychrophilus TaxID=330734 RepID=UPI002357217B|nr:HDOD domain-containing protein [Marinobacter psychrophilus]